MNPIIQVRNLTKVYGTGAAAFKALRGIDLTINTGEFLAVMGPSGSGKSTLMNLLGCLDTPSSGNYSFQDIAVETLDADQRSLLRRHALGFIFQGFNLLARTSALENVELPLLYRGHSRKKRRELAYEALAKVGLPDKARNTPAELSGGQQQRVAIARALATSPGTLDSRTTAEIMDLLGRLNSEQNITILMVTHEDEVASHAARIVTVRDGLIASDISNTTPPHRS